MEYWKQYEVLVANARENPSDLQGENHHIVPRSVHRFTPSTIAVNSPENMVFLSHQQHLMAHYLLWKMWEGIPQYGYSMAAAFRLMMDITKAKPTPRHLDEYANAKEAQKAVLRLRTGSNHPASIKVRDLKTGKLYGSIACATRSSGFSASLVWRSCNRRRESMLKGFFWRESIHTSQSLRLWVYEEDFQMLLEIAGLTESSLAESVTPKSPSFHRTWGYLLCKHNPTWLLNS